MSRTAPTTALEAGGRAGGRLGLALLVIATAQLMMVLDDTVANVALPSIQAQFDMSESALPWVINAYVLAFGGLLLFGGRAGDLYGRLRVLRLGLIVFTAASLAGGLAPTSELLIAARGIQGIGAALVAPNALALIATTFPAGTPRNKAMAVYGAMSALGITGGVLLGGLLTGALSWRWVLLINIPIGIAVLAGTRILVAGERHTGRLDTVGAVTGTAGFTALAYGFTRAGEHGWSDPVTLTALAAAVAALVLFVARQARSRDPLLPLRLLADRNRSGAYLTVLFIGAGLMGTFYLATLFMQQVLRFGPLQAGAAALPFGAGIILASGVASKLVEKLPPRAITAPGLLIAAAGMFWLSALDANAGYWTDLMVPLFITSAGLGLAFVPMTLTVVHDVDPRETGVASALMNTAQQIGAAIGLAVLTTVSATAAATRLPDAATALHTGSAGSNGDLVARAEQALSHGYTTAYLAAAVLLVAAAVLAAVTVTTRAPQKSAAAADTHAG
ncbi:MFS transporter [Actinoplanes sp. NPDC023936]|uniref:MFS transporter n=1 Tax=Actinoplanes sp. NPDC023936 TaxID=3154910 RepID=UPI0033C5250D